MIYYRSKENVIDKRIKAVADKLYALGIAKHIKVLNDHKGELNIHWNDVNSFFQYYDDIYNIWLEENEYSIMHHIYHKDYRPMEFRQSEKRNIENFEKLLKVVL